MQVCASDEKHHFLVNSSSIKLDKLSKQMVIYVKNSSSGVITQICCKMCFFLKTAALIGAGVEYCGFIQ